MAEPKLSRRERERARKALAKACERVLPKPGEFYDAELAFSWLLPDLLRNAPHNVLAARRLLFLGEEESEE